MPEFINSTPFIWHSIAYCGLFCACLVPIGLVNPRMMLQDYPKEIIAAVPPKTDTEKWQGIFFAIPLLVIMIGYPAIVSWSYSPGHEFSSLFINMWSLMLVMNIFDLLILDWIMFCAITPRFVVLHGTEGNPGYKNYSFHFIGFLKGLVITAVISSAVSGLMSFIS